jgi:hypothetical protein
LFGLVDDLLHRLLDALRGDMVIVYGVPYDVRGEEIGIYPTEHIRPVARALWRDDVLDYGRAGEAVRSLKTPLF